MRDPSYEAALRPKGTLREKLGTVKPVAETAQRDPIPLSHRIASRR